jgi:hypothetical protein
MDWREFTAQKVLKDTGCEATTVYAGKKPLVFPEDVLGIREVFGINGKAWLRKATSARHFVRRVWDRKSPNSTAVGSFTNIPSNKTVNRG